VDSKSAKKHKTEKPFDDSAFDRYSMYDNMPYEWDTDLNIEKVFRMETGNLIKGYRCKLEEPLELSFEV
jgi:hypothetical protein